MEIRNFLLPLEEGNGMRLMGVAAPYNSESVVMKTRSDQPFVEVFMTGSFTRTMSKADIFALVGHDTSKVLARTGNQTLVLEEDNAGLRFSMDVIDNSVGRDLMASVRRGDIDKVSVGFNVIRERWTKNTQGVPKREVLEAELFEISIVPLPVYTNTSVSARSIAEEVDVVVPEEINTSLDIDSDGRQDQSFPVQAHKVRRAKYLSLKSV